MHELSVCQALLSQVGEIAQAQGAVRIKCISIEVGPLSGTEPTLLLNAFMSMRAGASSAAALVIERGRVRVSCLECDAISEVPANRLLCGECGGFRTRVISGDELRLLRVELYLPNPLDLQGVHNQVELTDYV